MIRFLLIVACASVALGQPPKSLASLFTGRSGSALVYDFKQSRITAAWNFDRAQQRGLQPGSTLKPFILAAYIEAGMYNKAMGAEQALAHSNNEFFDRLIANMSPEEIERGYARFGLNRRAPSFTLAQMMAAGQRLVARHREARLRPVFAGMEQAAQYGTARNAAIAATTVAGKTGTSAQSAMFFGYAPAASPRYVVWIQLDSGTGGGDAAPFAAKIFATLFSVSRDPFDPTRVSLRLFWQHPPDRLNLKPGDYPAGTTIDTGQSKLRSPGPLKVALKDGHYELTTQVDLEDYVTAVLHGEAGGFQHAASREAMAIAARTYAARFRRRHSEEGFDFCDTTHCQDARFVAAERKDLRDVVEATASELIWFNAKPAAAYYHADSGGWLEASSDAPYLKHRKDPWWQDTPAAHWAWKVSIPNLAAALNLTIIRPTFAVKQREESGRARALDVFGHPAEAAAFRMLVGRTLGWEKMPSRMFDVKVEAGQITFSGKGRGHGIGLAQSSAERMAADGKSAAQILAEYFPGTTVGIGTRGLRWKLLRNESVTLRTTEPARDGALLAQAASELRKLKSLTGLEASPSIWIYPSREAFRDATGITAAVHGATRGASIRLPTGASLSTLRHELLHALIETNVAPGHPEWLREGLVQALLGEPGDDAQRASALIVKYGAKQLLRNMKSSSSPL